MKPIEPVSLAEIRAAAERIKGLAMRTPLVPLNVEDAPARIYLKLENLQPIGSFKLRGAGNVLAQTKAELLKDGVYTASAGNTAQGVAWVARQRGVPCSIVVPDHAPKTKLDAIARLGATAVPLPFDDWWDVLVNHGREGMEGLFIHPVSDPAVIAGNGTIGLEIHEDLPEVEAVVVPFGGGGLSSGIACALRALKPTARVHAAEVDTAAPLSRSLAAGEPTEVPYQKSLVDGIGAKSVLVEMWPLVSEMLAGSLVVTVEQVKAAIRILVERNRVVPEGAGATSVAAALAGKAGSGPVVCVVSGGNIDPAVLAGILAGS